MKRKLKRLEDQVVVITGASSAIGLTTAEMALARGAAVVLAARSETELAFAASRLGQNGGRLAAVAADVTEEREVLQIARVAMIEFGRIDTWINNAGIEVYGRLVDQPIADKRKLFEINFWGVVNGCRAAVEQMRADGGTIVNLGSELPDHVAALAGVYRASQQAVRAYTDTLRLQLEHDRIPIQVSLVQPGPIDATFPRHASQQAGQPKPAPPADPLESIAQAILKCAEKPVREIAVGGGPRLEAAMAALAPRVGRLMKEGRAFDGTRRRAYTRAALSDVGRALPLMAIGAIVAVAAARRQ